MLSSYASPIPCNKSWATATQNAKLYERIEQGGPKLFRRDGAVDKRETWKYSVIGN